MVPQTALAELIAPYFSQGRTGRPPFSLATMLLIHFMLSQQLTASTVHYDVLPAKRALGSGVRLLKAFEQWCENRHRQDQIALYFGEAPISKRIEP